MRGFYRWMRRGMSALLVVGLVGGILYYLVFTLTGIAEEIDRRATLRDRDALLIQTTTALAPTLQAQAALSLASVASPTEAQAALIFEETPVGITEIALLPSETSLPATALPTDLPPAEAATLTLTATETETVLPSETPTETLMPSETATATPLPSDTLAGPSGTPTEIAQLATLIPTNTERPTSIPTNTERPSRTPSYTPTETFTPTDTLTPTSTLTPSVTPTFTETPTATLTPTSTLTPTATATASSTPTSTNTSTPSPSPYPIEGTYATPVTTPIVSFPPRAPVVEDDPNIVNVVLLGSDSRGQNIGRTDVIIVVSVNKTLGSVSMWHIPRDLLVYIPGNTVDRMNRAYPLGREMNFPGGGPGMVKETILYNFGIPIDYYALINFSDFEQIIEKMGGLEISVDCQIEDWALITPDADPTVEENYERYTMRIGRQKLTPYYALWYARSRKGTGDDFDRGRRQIDILRAIFNQARQQGLTTQITELYPEMAQIVDTDMGLTDMLDFIPLASNLDLSSIERFNGVLGVHFDNFTTPDDGRAVLLPNYENIYKLVRDFVTPPTGSRVDRAETSIEVFDASAYGIGFDLVASDRLAWEGFRTFPGGQISGVQQDQTTIYDYTGETKGSALERIMEIMRVGEASVVFQPDPNRTVDYRIEVGKSYNTCVLGSSADELDEGPPINEDADPDAQPETVG